MKSLQFLILFFLKSVHGFNFDTDVPIIFKQPLATNEKTYFGYTVAMYPGDMINDEWIRIGAPKANDTNSNIPNPGMVYNCKVSEGCKPISLINSIQNQQAEWVDGWIGGTMDVSYHFKRHIVCGFHQYYKRFGDYRTMGSCYWSFLNSSSFYQIDKILDPAFGLKKYESATAYYYGQGEAGFSAHFPEHENELILGAPGVANWAGTSIRIIDEQLEDPEPSRKRRKRELRHFKTVEVAEPSVYDANKLHGYSVTSGYYYGKTNLYYASSRPKDNTGTVITFKFQGNQQSINPKQKILGEQLGEYFGGCLASGDINNDNFDDLIIGSPFFKGSTYNEGKVYIFLGAKDNLKKSMVLNGMHKNGQFGTSIMFMGDLDSDGYREVAIGSPYENENTGSVYIYKGNNNGLDMIPCQKIIGKEIYPGLLGFGVTISKPVDMDGNKFKDVAIGSYLSGHTVLFRSRPIVAVKYTFTTIPEILQIDTKIFDINICFSYSLYSEDSVYIKYAISMDKTYGRASIGSNKTKNITVNIIAKKNITNCENITVTLEHNLTTSYKNMPIQAFITYALDYPRVNKSVIFSPVKARTNKFYPVLVEYKSSPTSFETDIPFTLGCASNNECISYLEVDMEFPELLSNKLLIGSRQDLKMIVTIKNLGENAYSTKLNVILPNSIFFGRTPTRCTSLIANEIICDIANPLRNNTEKSIEFDLDIKSLDQGLYYDSLKIVSKINTTSNNRNESVMTRSLDLSSEADITINGKSEQDKNYYGTSIVNSTLLTHELKVEKFGVSPIRKINVTLQVPHKLQTKEGQIEFISLSSLEAYFREQPMNCYITGTDVVQKKETVIPLEDIPAKRRRRQVETFKNISQGHKKEDIIIDDEEITINANKTLYLNCSTNGVTCFYVDCNFGPYSKDHIPASISLKMDVNNAKLTDVAKDKDAVLISTYGEVRIDFPRNFIQNGNRSDTITISSILVNENRKQTLALWIFILAIILGLMLLSILIFVLVKAGFFNRSKKEELENLKAAATQEAKILEIIENSKSVDDELDPSGEEQLEVKSQPPVTLQTNSSQENLIDS